MRSALLLAVVLLAAGCTSEGSTPNGSGAEEGADTRSPEEIARAYVSAGEEGDTTTILRLISERDRPYLRRRLSERTGSIGAVLSSLPGVPVTLTRTALAENDTSATVTFSMSALDEQGRRVQGGPLNVHLTNEANGWRVQEWFDYANEVEVEVEGVEPYPTLRGERPSGPRFIIGGTLANRGNKDVELVEATLYYLDSTGTTIGESEEQLFYSGSPTRTDVPLRPNYVREWEAYPEEGVPPAFDSVRVEVTNVGFPSENGDF